MIEKRGGLKRLFNTLPWIQKDRRPGKNTTENNPWFTLYYSQDTNVDSLGFWTKSNLGWFESRMVNARQVWG